MMNLKHHEIIYCVIEMLIKSKDMIPDMIYSIRQSINPKYEDVVLVLIPGAPLLITQNLDSSLDESHFILNLNRVMLIHLS
jgi:hypothetical protein